MRDVAFTPDAIEDGLWVGRAPNAPEDFSLLRTLGVQDVLTLQTDREARIGGILPPLAFRIAVVHGIALHRIEIPDLDSAALRTRAPEASRLLLDLRARGRRVYVHCAVGLNRSPTVVAGYLALSRGIGAEEACTVVMERHACVPDPDAVRAVIRKDGTGG